jgi:hypothetical protein
MKQTPEQEKEMPMIDLDNDQPVEEQLIDNVRAQIDTRTLGDRVKHPIFESANYFGLGYLANATVSVIASHKLLQAFGDKIDAWAVKHSGHVGRWLFSTGSSIRSLIGGRMSTADGSDTDWLLKENRKERDTRRNRDRQKLGKTFLKNSVLIGLLSSGGFVMLYPMKWMEENRPTIEYGIKRFVNFITFQPSLAKMYKKGGNIEEEEYLKELEKTQENVGAKTEQSWLNASISRIVAVAAALGAKTYIDRGLDLKNEEFVEIDTPPGEEPNVKATPEKEAHSIRKKLSKIPSEELKQGGIGDKLKYARRKTAQLLKLAERRLGNALYATNERGPVYRFFFDGKKNSKLIGSYIVVDFAYSAVAAITLRTMWGTVNFFTGKGQIKEDTTKPEKTDTQLIKEEQQSEVVDKLKPSNGNTPDSLVAASKMQLDGKQESKSLNPAIA